MEDYIFHEGPLPLDDYQLDVELSLFNESKYLTLQADENWHSFSILNKKTNTICGAVFFNIKDAAALSPVLSPFASFDLSPELYPVTIFEFLEFVDARLKAHGVKTIRIKEAPSLYHPHRSALVQTFLFNQGYQVCDAESGAIIQIDGLPFREKVNDSERGRLRQAREAGLQFRKIELSNLTDVYLFIFGCQKQRGYTLSMTLSALNKTVEHFSDRFVLFGIYEGEKLIAASIAIHVKSHVLYNFYCTHLMEYNHLSPVVMLLEGLYSYGRNHYVRILDLGTSAVDGRPNFGLLDFKLRMGAQPTTKFTFEKIIL